MSLLDVVIAVTIFAGRLNANDYDKEEEPDYHDNTSSHVDGLRLVAGRQGNLTFLVLVEVRGSVVCSGALISLLWAVTAAHCVDGAPRGAITLKAGHTEPKKGSRQQTWEQERGLSALEVMPSQKRMLFDMALMRAQQRFQRSALVRPVAVCRNWGFPHRGELCLAAGWRLNGTHQFRPGYLMVHALNYFHCFQYYGVRFHKSMVCAKAEAGNSLCMADSGGPLVCGGLLVGVAKGLVDVDPLRDELIRSPEELRQVACGGNRTFMAYTAMGKYRRWIRHFVPDMKMDWLARAALPTPSLLLSAAAALVWFSPRG